MDSKKRVTFGCCLRSGGDYTAEHVRALERNVRRFAGDRILFVCFSDLDLSIPGVVTVPLQHNYPGWWSIPELFRIRGPVMVTGLDTVCVGDLTPLLDLATNCKADGFYMIRAFADPAKTASGIMIWNGDWSRLYRAFNYKQALRKVKDRVWKGEQDYTNAEHAKMGTEIHRIQDHVDGIYSYKWHCKEKLPEDARVVLFHGKPRPQDARADWLKEYYSYSDK